MKCTAPAGRTIGVAVLTGLLAGSVVQPAFAKHGGDALDVTLECTDDAQHLNSVDVQFSERGGDGSHRLDISAQLEGMGGEVVEVALLDHDLIYELQLGQGGQAEAGMDSREGDDVPAVDPDDMVEVRYQGDVILYGTFDAGEADSDGEADSLGAEGIPPSCPETRESPEGSARVPPGDARIDDGAARGPEGSDSDASSDPQTASSAAANTDPPTRAASATTVVVVALVVWAAVLGYVVWAAILRHRAWSRRT